MCTTSCNSDQAISLSVIMHKHDTDKLQCHHYEEEYERHFAPLRHNVLTLLEIGIGGWNVPGVGGAGLKTWADYFPLAQIVGLDIEDKSFLDKFRIRTCIGNQRNREFLFNLNGEHGPFDIVIDDGSHVQEDVLTSFETLFPLLNPGGIYVIEDLETAYVQAVKDPGIGMRPCGGRPSPLTGWRALERRNVIPMICTLVDGVHHEFWKYRKPSEIQKMVQSIHVSKELVFIYKQP